MTEESVQHSNIAEEEMGQLHGIHFCMNAEAAVRRRVYVGHSRSDCCCCGADIPLARQQALPGVTRCVACQEEEEKHSR